MGGEVKKWAEMSARERDALVAEKVMEWTNCTVEGHNKDIAYGKPSDFDETDPVVRITEFTTDISAAWEVVEKAMIGVIPQAGAPDDMRYMAEAYKHNYAEVDIRVFASTAPEAICLAALRDVGVDV